MEELLKVWADHNRRFEDFNFVYPVISRRAKGLSIGVNCTPNGVCSYDCIYCQVVGAVRAKTVGVVGAKNLLPLLQPQPNVNDIISELKKMLSIYNQTKFAEHFSGIEEKNRILKDIALSGDGEPTLYPHFAELCEALKEVQSETPKTKLILITNATHITQKNKKIIAGLEFLCSKNGEIWGKLDAGTDKWLQFIDRPTKKIGISEIENNLKFTVSKFPMRIQTMLCEAQGKSPGEAEIESYVKAVERIYEVNPQNLLSVQLYSVARQTAENTVKPVSKEFLESVKIKLQEKISKLPIETF